MSFLDNLQYKTENASLYFQGGVRRSIIIFAGICVALLAPFYFIGQFSSNIWNGLDVNSKKFNSKNIVNLKNVQEVPYEVSETQVVPLANGDNSLYLTINNKTNPTIGYFPFVYTVQVLDKNNSIIEQKQYRNYLLPGDIKFVIVQSTSEAVNLKLIREPQTVSVLYNPNANQILKKPNIQIQSENIQIDAAKQKLTLTTTIRNEEVYRIKQIDFRCIIRGSRGEVVGIFEYTFDSTAPGERTFSVDYPLPKDKVASFPEVIWSVNYLDRNTFITN